MALVLKDRVLETSQTSGTGTIALSGAVNGFQTFSSAIGNTNTTYYAIIDDADNQWEVGLGTVGAGTLTRDTVYSSSNGGSKVNFGTSIKNVFCDYPASKSVYEDESGNVTGYPISGGTINGTTIGATTPSTGAFTTATASTSVTTPIVKATNSAGLALKNSGGTTQISMGAGGGDNVTVAVSTNLNGTNAQIDISPTGTGHVHIKPTGVNSVEIAPTYVGEMDNITIGATTPAAGTFTTITGQTEVLSGTGQNLALQSQTYTNAIWSTSTGTRADNVTTAPNGTTTAGTITTVNTIYGGLLRQNITLIATTYTLSAYVKKNNYRYVGLRFGNVLNGDRFAFFDFDTLTTNTAGIAGATLTATDAGSGWYRIALTGANTAILTILDLSPTDSNGNVQTNLGAGQIVNVWGLQLELGSTANTYIPTTTTAVYGTPTLSFSGVAGLGLQSDGSLYASSAGTGNIRFYTNNVALEQMRVSSTASAVDYLQVTGATTASKVVAISAQGSDTDVTLSLAPKGAGTIRFGTYTAGILTPAGYITITDSGGTSRRLLVG
jgi:hypothetical protein